MIVVTGAAGFIGSCLVAGLNEAGYKDLVLVDDFSREDRAENLREKTFTSKVDRNSFPQWLEEHHRDVQFIFHIGARTDTAEFDMDLLNRLNLEYTKTLWNQCARYGIGFVYASSAATYGNGEHGFEDDETLIPHLEPLNPYGISKNEFDKWALKQEQRPYFWVGLKFFNVYGPNEYHKGRMASVIFHAYNQIRDTGAMKLFRSHNPDYPDGGQMRDFVYVKDVVAVCLFWLHTRKGNGIYNLGSGKARTFNDLALSTFKAMGLEPAISYIDTPEDIRDKYQYYTKASMEKLKRAGYDKEFTELEDGIDDYVRHYLMLGDYL